MRESHSQMIPEEVLEYPDIDPAYSLLLGRHWMKQTAIQGDYERETYTIRQDDGTRTQIPRVTPYDQNGDKTHLIEMAYSDRVETDQPSDNESFRRSKTSVLN